MSLGGGGKKSMSNQIAEAAKPAEAAPPVKDEAKLRRAGRASLLIATTSQGVLGNATTGRRQLLGGTS